MQDALSIDLPFPDENICTTDHILIDEEVTTNNIEQGIESVETKFSSEQCVDLNDFVTKNKDSLAKIAKLSEYSMYRNPQTPHESVFNLLSTKLKLRDTGGNSYGDGSQEDIYGAYRKLRKEKYPAKKMDNLLEEALNNCPNSIVKKKYQSKIGDFFQRKSEVSKMVEEEDTIEVVGQEEENEHVETDIHDTDPKGLEMLGSSLGLKLKIICENSNPIINLLASNMAPLVRRYETEMDIFKKHMKYSKDNSIMSNNIKETATHIEELRGEIASAEKILSTAQLEAEMQPMFSQIKIFGIAKEKVDIKLETITQVMTKSKPTLTNTIKLLEKRNYENMRRHKCPVTVNEFHTRNSSKSWHECLEELKTKKPRAFGVSLSYEEYQTVFLYAKEKSQFNGDELIKVLKREMKDLPGVEKLIVDHLPIIKITLEGKTSFWDTDEVMENPKMVIEMWNIENREQFSGIPEEEGYVIVGRKEGSGKKRAGKYILSVDMCKEVQEYINFCGTPAHERR